jgi:hypothetical protein
MRAVPASARMKRQASRRGAGRRIRVIILKSGRLMAGLPCDQTFYQRAPDLVQWYDRIAKSTSKGPIVSPRPGRQFHQIGFASLINR